MAGNRLSRRLIQTTLPARVGKALKAAQSAGARRAILVGPDEWAEGRVVLKDLDSGDETQVSVEDLA